MSQTLGPRAIAWETIFCKSYIDYFGLGPYSVNSIAFSWLY